MTMMMKMQNQDWPPSRIFTSNYNFLMGFSVPLACVQPSPPPFPSGKIGEGPLLRFFLREGAGGVCTPATVPLKQESFTQAKDIKLLLFLFLSKTMSVTFLIIFSSCCKFFDKYLIC